MTTEQLPEVLQQFLRSRLDTMHTCLPGRFESYEGHVTRKSKVKPLAKYRTPDNQNIDMPIIDNVPVIFPSAGAFNLLYPIKRGDGCLILFAESGIGNYLAGTGQPVNSDDQSRFSLTDAIAIPGMWTFRNSPKNADRIELTDSGDLEIEVGGNLIKVGKLGTLDILGASESFVKGDTLFNIWNTYLTALSTGIVPGDPVANAASLTAIKFAAASLQAQLATILSITIKGE